QRVARLDDPDGRRVRVAARAPELEVRALLDVIERALAIELPSRRSIRSASARRGAGRRSASYASTLASTGSTSTPCARRKPVSIGTDRYGAVGSQVGG